MTRQTYLQRRWPETPLFQEAALRWCADRSRLLLHLVWRAYDELVQNDLQKVPFSEEDEAKEESLNFLVTLRIGQCMTGDEPFAVIPEVPEQAKRRRGRGKSPQPDIGFVLYEFPRSVWPMEGKVLPKETGVKPYVEEINANLLSGRYGAFSCEGAMLGYLLRGDPGVAFHCIEVRIERTLQHHPSFPDRHHKISDHQREDLPHPNAPGHFCCHHLLLLIPSATTD